MKTRTIDITLNLDELIKLEYYEEYHTGGIIRKGEVFNTDELRPKRILELTKKKFAPIIAFVNIRLGNKCSFTGRCLVAGYVQGMDPEIIGRAALFKGKKRLSSITPDDKSDKGVTAYIYEGSIFWELYKYKLKLKIQNLENIYTVLICHEIGHNLGLNHVNSPTDMMFRFENTSSSDKKIWLQNAALDKLLFKPKQLQKMVLSF